jgi:hypothetical protein
MPEIARFLGIIIRMYAEPSAPHHRPHFHAYYQDAVLTVRAFRNAVPRIGPNAVKKPHLWGDIRHKLLAFLQICHTFKSAYD